MKRRQRILDLLAARCAEQLRGFDAAELADMLAMARHNVSADLNQLWREGLVVKLPGRPVRFWEREAYRAMQGPITAQTGARPSSPDPLAGVIGAQESLRSQIEQAKAAVLYPPSGLHTLLVGPTGVGKSHLAELMHSFGVASGRLAPGKPLVTLNCADYAHNPQLLMAHLFGAVKGAYTGADQERQGLVDQADGGILFLDEVHRLPAEGQEMLFRLIDKGLYRRLGEAGNERSARVMLIAATTERVDSALLRTFTRRIPMVISLPPLSERTAGERLRFVRRFLRTEASKIGVDITVPQETVRMLLEYECLGNVGQLRNDIRLACARLFLSYLTQKREPMELLPVHLPEHIHRTVPPARHRSMEVSDLVRSLGDRMVIEKRVRAQGGGEEQEGAPLSFYSLIERQVQELQRQGMAPSAAEGLVLQDIAGHFQEFLDQVRHRHQSHRQELSILVGQEVLRAVERAMLWAEERLGRALPERVIYALAMHIHGSVERTRAGLTSDYHIPHPGGDQSPEVEVAAGLIALIERELGAALPPSDITFAALLLRPEAEKPLQEQVGIVVVAHGRVASAMTDVAHALTGTDLAHAIDMELDQDPSVVEEQLIARAREGVFPGGLLLLADMGSLESMGDAVQQRASVPVRSVSMVSTPLVVEAVHQASVPGATLDQVYHALLTARSGMLGRDWDLGLPQVVLTFCFTGVGSAQTLARMVREALAQQSQRVEVIPASIGTGTGWNRLVATLLRSHRLLAAVGPFHPRIPGVPYISTEEIVVGHGARRLRQLVSEATSGGELPPEPLPLEPKSDLASVYVHMANTLGDYLKVTNPAATVPVILKALNGIEQYLNRSMEESLRIGLTMHLVCLLERKVRERLVQEAQPAAATAIHQGTLPWLPEVLKELTSIFHVQIDREELERLDEIISESVSPQG